MMDFSAGFNRVTSLIVPDESNLGPMIYTSRILETIGASSSIPIDRAQNRFRYAGRVRHTRGRHNLTTGFDVLRSQVNGVESRLTWGYFLSATTSSTNQASRATPSRIFASALRVSTCAAWATPTEDFAIGIFNTL